MAQLVQYENCGNYSTITMDDGKANVMSVEMSQQLNVAFDQAQDDENVVVLIGREKFFSGGFDIKVFNQPEVAMEMFRLGAVTAERLLSFPCPVVVACSGHAIAMGAFLLLVGDSRIGIQGDTIISTNEVEIGLTVPNFATEICRQRLSPAHFSRALITAAPYKPEQAVVAGFLDAIVPQEQLLASAIDEAERLAKLDRKSFVATKLRVREVAIEALAQGIAVDQSRWK